MKFTEMLIADISGGVFVDEVFMLKDPEGARRLADGVMMTLKSLHKNKGNIIAFEPKLSDGSIDIAWANDPFKRSLRVVAGGVAFRIVNTKNFSEHYAAGIAEELETVLKQIQRETWNQCGIRFALGLPSMRAAEKGDAGITLLRDRYLGQCPSELWTLFEGGHVRVADLTLRGEKEKRNLSINIYNTEDQDVAVTLDVKSNTDDALNGSLLEFMQFAYKLFEECCGPLAEKMTVDPIYRDALDLQYLKTGER